MIGLHKNQRLILEYLLDHPEGASLEEIAEHLKITKTAAKEHLIKVDGLGFLTHTDKTGSVGRPRRYYMLSTAGHESFPRQYSWLSNVLLKFLADDLGSASVTRIMQSIASEVAYGMRERFKKKSNPELFGEISKAMNELGYRSTVKQSDLRKGAVLEATNCVYHSVAKAHPELCSFDIKFIEEASGGMSVKLESCIARGGDVCRFCIRKKSDVR
jgi:DeoR family transcriptional regulator, suf operon transcriptional repressor